MIVFEERGFHGVRVDDVVRRAGISHGTFYLYFSNKEDLFKALLQDALRDMEVVAGDFPVVTRDQAGITVLRRWVRTFFDVYAAHATVIRILSQADLVPEEVYGDGLQMLFSISEAMTTGMTVASRSAGQQPEHVELTAVACLMMLERINYLLSAEVKLPIDEMANRIADIMFAAFGPSPTFWGAPARDGSNSSTWVSRMLLPDGSRNDVSMPYGWTVGGSLKVTPRALRSS